MFKLFKRPITASEAGKLGARVKSERWLAKRRRVVDEMREQLGMEPIDWTQFQ